MVLNTRDNGFMYYEKDRKKAGRCRRQTPRKAARRMASERLGRLIPPPDTSITARKRLPLPPQVSPEPSTYEYSRQDTTGQHSSAQTAHKRKRLSPPPLASLPLLPAITSRKHDRLPECVRVHGIQPMASSRPRRQSMAYSRRRKRPSVQPSGRPSMARHSRPCQHTERM